MIGKGVGRRGLAAVLAAGTTLAVRPATAAPRTAAIADIGKDADTAAVYHLDFGDPRRYGQMLDNVRNHLAAYEYDPLALKIVIVAHSAGIKFFLERLDGTPWAGEVHDPDLAARVAGLSGFGVQVFLCRFTFEKNNISLDRALTAPWLRMVPSGIATVAALQGKGFAYLKVG